MPLPDPELDLLREMLKEEPGAAAFVQVGQELLWRSRYEEAVDVLRAGIEASDDVPEAAWETLAEAAHKGGQVLRALGALEHLGDDPTTHEAHARLRVQILEAAGKLGEAKEAADAFLDVHPQDVVVEAVVARLAAPPPDVRKRLPDPLISVGRAEAYAALGRTDRAIRVLRRLWFHFPQDEGFRHRIAELSARPAEAPEDLSEEIDESGASGPPPGLTMPSPRHRISDITPDPTHVDTDPDGEMTDPAIGFSVEEIRRQIEERKRAALENRPPAPAPTPVPTPTPTDDRPFIYGDGEPYGDGDPTDEEPTITLPRRLTDATPEEIERQVNEVREKARKRRTLLKDGPS